MKLGIAVAASSLIAVCTAAGATQPVRVPAGKRPGKPAAAKTCADGDLDRCYADALALHFGDGVPKDVERALVLLKENCDKGHQASCATHGAVSAPPPTAAPTSPPAPPRPRVDIKTRLTEACEAGDSAKCLELARGYEHGQPPFEKDGAKALELTKKACEGTSGEACRRLAKEHLKGKGKEAKALLARAVELDGQACEGGDVKTCWRYGNAYISGEGAKQNAKRARAIFEDACTRKDAWSCTSLGDIYHHENGVDRDRKKAYHYYDMGCQLGASHGCFGQGLLLEALVNERHMPLENLAGVAELFQRACEGYTPGCWKLAACYKDGRGVPKDKAKAKEILDLACSRGHREACAGTYPEATQMVF